MSFFVQLWQQPHHDTDSTWMYNGAVSYFQPAVKKHSRIIINNSKEGLTMFQQSTALNPPSSNQAQHWKLRKHHKWPGTAGSLLRETKKGHRLLMSWQPRTCTFKDVQQPLKKNFEGICRTENRQPEELLMQQTTTSVILLFSRSL